MDTFLKVQTIFYSGIHAFRGDKEPINDIAFLLDQGYLILNDISIASKEKYVAVLDSVIQKEHAYYIAAGGSKNHIALKLLAADYLQEKGVEKILFEHLFCGAYPDVLSENKQIAVECGHTQNPEKMLTYFQQGNIKECIQIPYPVHEDTEVHGYSFTAGNDLNGFLNFLEKERRHHIKKLHKKLTH